jgi:hypothetical protein
MMWQSDRGSSWAAWAVSNVSASACSLLVLLKNAFNRTAAIDVRIMPSPKMGFKTSGNIRKKLGETIGIRPKPIGIATTSTLFEVRAT